MSEENEIVVEEPEIDYKSMVETLTLELEKTKKHNEELFTETKAAKKAREQETAEKQRIEKERAQRDGEFEKLFETAEAQRKELEQKLNAQEHTYRQEKIQTHAMKLAVELADGNATSAKLLSKFLQESISKIADEKGVLDDSVLVAVKREFQNNSDFAPLLAGSKAKGGGALGNSNGVAKQSTVDRTTYNTWDVGKQRDFVVNQKGSVYDN